MINVRIYNYAGCDLAVMTLTEFRNWINYAVPEDGDKFVVEIVKDMPKPRELVRQGNGR